MKKLPILTLIFVLALLAISGCGTSRNTSPTATATSDPSAALTAAAQTAEVRRNMTATAFVPTPTVAPTATSTPAVTNTPVITATVALPTQLVPGTAAPQIPSGADNSVYVEDRSVPDGTVFAAGASFVKTWRIMNTGTSTWGTGYNLAFISGDSMGAPVSVNLSVDVPPNQVVDISVNMVAPSTNGNYKGFWRMRNTAGQYFGESVYVEINVGSGGSSGPTQTPNPSGSMISNLTLSLNDTDVTAECPHEFAVSAGFTLREASTVTYELEAGSDTPGFEFNLPGPATVSFSAGAQTLTFSLEFSNSGSGWIRLHITSPEDVSSDEVDFTLTCQE